MYCTKTGIMWFYETPGCAAVRTNAKDYRLPFWKATDRKIMETDFWTACCKAEVTHCQQITSWRTEDCPLVSSSAATAKKSLWGDPRAAMEGAVSSSSGVHDHSHANLQREEPLLPGAATILKVLTQSRARDRRCIWVSWAAQRAWTFGQDNNSS